MTPANILTGIFVLLFAVVGYLIARDIFERVRVARWRRIREPRCYGDEGGHPVTGKAGD